jgi:hypothetical protein
VSPPLSAALQEENLKALVFPMALHKDHQGIGRSLYRFYTRAGE